MDLIEIFVENTGQTFKVNRGTRLEDLIPQMTSRPVFPFLGALVNNKLRELTFELFKPKTVFFVDLTHPGGMRIYSRSMSFVLVRAFKSLYPDQEIQIRYSVSKGLYWEITQGQEDLPIDDELVQRISTRMRELIQQDLEISHKEIPTTEAVSLFESLGYSDKVKLLNSRIKFYTSIYSLGGVVGYFYGPLVPSTGYLGSFRLTRFNGGILLSLPRSNNPLELEPVLPQNKMFEIFQEQKEWARLLGISSIGELNHVVKAKKVGELIKVAEALHEKKVAQIADHIAQRQNHIRVIQVAGPSSSGKTTFSKRLAIQLKVLGISPVLISMDHYFVDREKTPRDENGNYDFESIRALDLELFNHDLLELLNGKEVNLPRFSFSEGKRYYNNHRLSLEPHSVLLIEGIHGLNPELTSLISNELKYKIYVSALTTLSIDRHNLIPTTDNRLLRRIVRDHKFRGYSALDTLKQWSSVRAGEEKNIFPFQEQADIMFNTATLFELGVLKRYAEPLLMEVPENQPEYSEAFRLLKFLSYFVPITDREVPPTSILREFFGGSSFYYE